MTETKKIVLSRGGKLIRFYWSSDDEELKTEDITTEVPSPYLLHNTCFEIETGLTMKDVFVFLNQNLDYWDLIIGNWLKEYVTQSFEPVPQKNDSSNDYTFSYLYTYLDMSCSVIDGEKTSGFPFVCFGGKGFDKAGNEINLGFGRFHTAEFNDLPVKIESSLKVNCTNFDIDYLNYWTKKKLKDSDDPLALLRHRGFLQKHAYWLYSLLYRIEERIKNRTYDLGSCEISLFQFIYAIFYEFSFYGGIENRQKTFEELEKKVAKIKEGEFTIKP